MCRQCGRLIYKDINVKHEITVITKYLTFLTVQFNILLSMFVTIYEMHLVSKILNTKKKTDIYYGSLKE